VREMRALYTLQLFNAALYHSSPTSRSASLQLYVTTRVEANVCDAWPR
jgi:hypothetical protein